MTVSHLLICLASRSLHGVNLPEASASCELFFRTFLDTFPDAFDVHNSVIAECSNEDAIRREFQSARLCWDNRTRPTDDDCVICTVTTHGLRFNSDLEILAPGFTLRKLDGLLDELGFPQVAVLLDACSHDAPRLPENFNWMANRRMYVDAVDRTGTSWTIRGATSVFSRAVAEVAGTLAASMPEVQLQGLINRVTTYLEGLGTPGPMRCDVLIRSPFHCVLKSSATPRRMLDLLVQDLLKRVFRERNLKAIKWTADTQGLSAEDRVYVLIEFGKEVFGRGISGYTGVQFLRYLSAVGRTRATSAFATNDGVKAVERLWQLERVSPDAMFAALVQRVIPMRLLDDAARSQGQVSVALAALRGYLATWLAQTFPRNTELRDRATRLAYRLTLKGASAALKAAAEVPIDADYELASTHVHNLTETGGKMYGLMFQVSDPTLGTGPEVFNHCVSLVHSTEGVWSLPMRRRFLAKLATRLADGRHWGLANQAFRLLTETHDWHQRFRGESSRSDSQLGRIDILCARKARELESLMRREAAPARWRVELLVSHYEWYYTSFEPWRLVLEGRSRRRRVARAILSRAAEELVTETADLEGESLLIADILLLVRAETLIEQLIGVSGLSMTSRNWLFDKKADHDSYIGSLNSSAFDRLAFHISLVAAAVELKDPTRCRTAVQKLVDFALRECSKRGAHRDLFLAAFVKELETALAVVQRMEERGLVTVDGQLRERVKKLAGARRRFRRRVAAEKERAEGRRSE